MYATVIVSTSITFIVSSVLGWSLNSLKSYKKELGIEREALLCLLRSNITGKCIKYLEMYWIPQEEKANINMMSDVYKKMGGNSYVIELVKEVNKLKTSVK